MGLNDRVLFGVPVHGTDGGPIWVTGLFPDRVSFSPRVNQKQLGLSGLLQTPSVTIHGWGISKGKRDSLGIKTTLMVTSFDFYRGRSLKEYRDSQVHCVETVSLHSTYKILFKTKG